MNGNKYVEFQIILPSGDYLVKCKSCQKLHSMSTLDFHNGINPCGCKSEILSSHT